MKKKKKRKREARTRSNSKHTKNAETGADGTGDVANPSTWRRILVGGSVGDVTGILRVWGTACIVNLMRKGRREVGEWATGGWKGS